MSALSSGSPPRQQRLTGVPSVVDITISRSDWAVTFRAPLFFMVPSPLSLAASRLLRRLQLLEHGVEAFEIPTLRCLETAGWRVLRRLSGALW